MSTYAEQLKHPKWQRRRLEIMQRDGFRCTRCAADETTPNVHHTEYRKGAAPWDYPDDKLLTLCEDCHSAEHKQPIDDVTLARVSRALRLNHWLVEDAVRALWLLRQSKDCPGAVREWWVAANAFSCDERLRLDQEWADEDLWIRLARFTPAEFESRLAVGQAATARRVAAREASGL